MGYVLQILPTSRPVLTLKLGIKGFEQKAKKAGGKASLHVSRYVSTRRLSADYLFFQSQSLSFTVKSHTVV